jgi:TPR repeat protein
MDASHAAPKALYFYRRMLSYGLQDALLPMARCHLAQFGGQTDLEMARVYLRKALLIEQYAREAQMLWETQQLGR